MALLNMRSLFVAFRREKKKRIDFLLAYKGINLNSFYNFKIRPKTGKTRAQQNNF